MPGSTRTGQVRRNKARKGQVWTGQVKTDPVRTCQVRIYQVAHKCRSAELLPAKTKDTTQLNLLSFGTNMVDNSTW